MTQQVKEVSININFKTKCVSHCSKQLNCRYTKNAISLGQFFKV